MEHRRTIGRTHGGIALSLAILAIGLAGPALALDRPTPQPLTRPGLLKERPTQIAMAPAAGLQHLGRPSHLCCLLRSIYGIGGDARAA